MNCWRIAEKPSRHLNEIFQYKIKLKIITIIIAKHHQLAAPLFCCCCFSFVRLFILFMTRCVVTITQTNKQIEIVNWEKHSVASTSFIERKTIISFIEWAKLTFCRSQNYCIPCNTNFFFSNEFQLILMDSASNHCCLQNVDSSIPTSFNHSEMLFSCGKIREKK